MSTIHEAPETLQRAGQAVALARQGVALLQRETNASEQIREVLAALDALLDSADKEMETVYWTVSAYLDALN
jgi:enamine deaminase RidA (YjgF/YER057c/UK114 family)